MRERENVRGKYYFVLVALVDGDIVASSEERRKGAVRAKGARIFHFGERETTYSRRPQSERERETHAVLTVCACASFLIWRYKPPRRRVVVIFEPPTNHNDSRIRIYAYIHIQTHRRDVEYIHERARGFGGKKCL